MLKNCGCRDGKENIIYFNDKCHYGKSLKFNSPKKVVFSEPYESIPNFYINNNFKKGENKDDSKLLNQVSPEIENIDLNQNTMPPPPMFNNMFNNMFNGGLGGMINSLFKNFGSNINLNSILSNPELISNLSKLFFKGVTNKKHNPKQTDFNIDDYTRVE